MSNFMNIGPLPKIYEARKVSDAFDFKRGHKFEAEIKSVSKDNTSVTLKLKDGTEITAKLDASIKEAIAGFVKFEVSGFDKGQLRLKLVKENLVGQGSKSLNDSLELILNKFGLEPEKKQMLEKMLKFNIPVTKENVELLNTLTDFRDKSINNPKHIANFIETYIASKGQEVNVEQKPVIEQKLNEFFKTFRNMNDNDIMTFLESDIDINTENIKSFDNVTKNSSGVFKSIENANGELKTLIDENATIKENLNLKSENKSKDINTRNIVLDEKNNSKATNISENIGDRIQRIKANITTLTNLDVDILKGLEVKEMIKNLANNLNEVSKEIPVSEKLTEALGKVINNFEILDKSSMESLKNIFEFAKKEIAKVEQGFKLVISSEKVLNEGENLKDIFIDDEIISNPNNTIKNIGEKIQSAKNDLNSLVGLDSRVLKNSDAKEVIKNLANNLNEISKEIPVSEKLTKVLDKVINNFENLDKSSMESLKNVFEFAKKEIVKVEQDFGVMIKENTVENSNKANNSLMGSKELDSVLRDFKEVKLGLNEKQEYMKDSIRNLVDKLGANETTSQVVMAVLKDKISDFKMFNDLSNDYYYLDVPLSVREEEYPCKLVIKDERKDGKKLDGKNIKLAVSVETVRIGSVDAFLSVSDKNIKIDIKIMKQNVNLLEKNKEKLSKTLEQLGFMPYIFVSEKKEIVESNISDFREFFSDRNTIALDKKV